MDTETKPYKYRFPIFAWLIILWPLGWILGIFLEDPNPNILTKYVVYSTYLYPAYVLISMIWARRAYEANAAPKKIMLISLIPLFGLIGLPYLLIFFLLVMFFAAVSSI